MSRMATNVANKYGKNIFKAKMLELRNKLSHVGIVGYLMYMIV